MKQQQSDNTIILVVMSILAITAIFYVKNGGFTIGGVAFSTLGGPDSTQYGGIGFNSFLVNGNLLQVSGEAVLNTLPWADDYFAPRGESAYEKTAILVDGNVVKVCGPTDAYQILDRVQIGRVPLGLPCNASIDKTAYAPGIHTITYQLKSSPFYTFGNCPSCSIDPATVTQYTPDLPAGYALLPPKNLKVTRSTSDPKVIDVEFDLADIYADKYIVSYFGPGLAQPLNTPTRGQIINPDVWSTPHMKVSVSTYEATSPYEFQVVVIPKGVDTSAATQRLLLPASSPQALSVGYGVSTVVALPPANGQAIRSCDGKYLRCVGTAPECHWQYAFRPPTVYSCADQNLSFDARLAKFWGSYGVETTLVSDALQFDTSNGQIIYINVPVNLTQNDCAGGSIVNNRCYIAVNSSNGIINNTVVVLQNQTVYVNNTVTNTVPGPIDYTSPEFLVGGAAALVVGILLARMLR